MTIPWQKAETAQILDMAIFIKMKLFSKLGGLHNYYQKPICLQQFQVQPLSSLWLPNTTPAITIAVGRKK